MGAIGSLGDLVFQVSAKQVRTFQDFTRNSSARWADHERQGAKQISEFLGADLDEITFTMRFDAALGVNPKQEMDRLLNMNRSGTVSTLIIGGTPIGTYKWSIRSVGQTWKTIDAMGRIINATVDVTLKEYVRR